MTPTKETVQLSRAMWDQMVDHARREFPRECCGIISGPDGQLEVLHELVNLYEGVDFYEIDDLEVYRLYVHLEERDRGISAIYHSHPVSVAYPSRRDVEHAGWPDAVYFICSLEIPDAPSIRAYRIIDEVITELAIDLID